MNVGIGTEAAQFLFQEYINWIFGTVLNRESFKLQNKSCFSSFFDSKKWPNLCGLIYVLPDVKLILCPISFCRHIWFSTEYQQYRYINCCFFFNIGAKADFHVLSVSKQLASLVLFGLPHKLPVSHFFASPMGSFFLNFSLGAAVVSKNAKVDVS